MKGLIIIDMQNDLCRDVRRRDKVDAMIDSMNLIIDSFHSANQPIFYVCFRLPEDDPQFRRFGDRYCIEGTPGIEIIPELQPIKGPIIWKTKHSAFFETELDASLKSAGVTDIFLCGLQTHICIMTTAADASFRGYRTVAVRECVVSSRESNKNNALNWIHEYVGEVLCLSDIVKELADG